MLRQRRGVALLLVAVAACATATTTAATQDRPLELYAIEGQTIRLIHETPRPARLSTRHHEVVVRAERLYEQRQFAEVIALLEPLAAAEPTNPFILDLYARALFWTNDRPRSFAVYRDVVLMLDAAAEAPAEVVPIDGWFIDAYWKLGVLHLDRGEWQRAAFEISRALASGLFDEKALDMALGYLTEAYFHLGNDPVASYYGGEAVRRNPTNTYVRPYLSRIPSL
jgi:tetratricopeptide (TPR) repeat protein